MAIRCWRIEHLTRGPIPSSIRVVALGCLSFLLWVAVATLWSSTADAAPAAPIEITLKQPGGKAFSAQPFGDEWNNGFETPSGFTIVRDRESARESGTWEYAVKGPRGGLEPSGKAVGLDAPPTVQKHLRSEVPSEAPQSREQAPVLESPALANPNSGTQRSLVILVQFPDQEASVYSTSAQWNSRFFGATNSVKHYYNEVSYGQLSIAPATESDEPANDGVVGWLTMGTNHPNTAGNTGTANRTLTRDAVIAADPSVNYASYDSNGDGFLSSRELHVTVIVAGQEAAGWSHLGKSVWGHAWSLFGTERPTVDGVVFGDSGHGGGYTQFGEWHGDHMATIGIMVHEMGHDLYLPDLYDTNAADGTSEGVGNWSAMGGGTWLATPGTHQGSTPAHLDAWSKSYEGWLTPQRLSGTQAIAQAETNATAIQLRDNPGGVDWTFNTSSGTGEYFLVENRQRVGYDAALPGCGLLVWHIDETRTSSNSANADETRKLVDLEEADGFNHLDSATNRGDAGDPYPGSSNNTRFNDTSNPNSRLYSGSSSGVASENMTGPCSSTMSAALDIKPPKVTSTNPANKATGIAPGANVKATFSEAMDAITTDGDPSTIKTATFKLKKAGTTNFLGATVTYDSATKKATLNPSANLQSGATYVATVTTGAKDLAGNALDQNPTTAGNQAKTWTFKVA